jgi:hypothetical protein
MIIPVRRVRRNNPSFAVINLFKESLKNLNAKSEPSRKPHDRPIATQTMPSAVMSFGRVLNTEGVYILSRLTAVMH